MASMYSLAREVRKRVQHAPDETNVGGISIEAKPDEEPEKPTPKKSKEVIDPFTPEHLNKVLGKSPEVETA